MNFKIIKETEVFKGQIFTFCHDNVVLPNGREVERDVIHYPGSTAIIPFLDDETILMLRHFRYAVKSYLWEIPAGMIEPGGNLR